VIVAGESATFSDLPHFAGGIVPGDGIFPTCAFRVGPCRVEAWLLNPSPISARAVQDRGVVSEVVPDGTAIARARELADIYLARPDLNRRNNRIHFILPLKQEIAAEVGYGLGLEGASAAGLVKSMST
jgi:enoyl-CoA hydratase/carnithine racemase